MRLRLAGEADDERGADRDARDARANPPDQADDVLVGGFAAHRLQHRRVDVLQRHVHIPRHLVIARDALDQLVAPVRRVGVKQANPEIPLDLLQRVEQPRERRPARGIDRLRRAGAFLPLVHAEVRGVLADEVDLPDAFGNEMAHLGDHGVNRPAAMPPAHLRDHAERTRVIAPLGDLGESGVRRGEPEARRVVVGNVNRLARHEVERLPYVIGQRRRARQQPLDDRPGVGHLVKTDEGVHLRHLCHQLLGKPLGHAPGDDQPLACPSAQPALLVRLEDRFDGLLLRRINKRAGVDDQHVGLLGIGGDLHPALDDAAEHHLRVHEVLRTTEADDPDFDLLFFRHWHFFSVPFWRAGARRSAQSASRRS